MSIVRRRWVIPAFSPYSTEHTCCKKTISDTIPTPIYMIVIYSTAFRLGPLMVVKLNILPPSLPTINYPYMTIRISSNWIIICRPHHEYRVTAR